MLFIAVRSMSCKVSSPEALTSMRAMNTDKRH